MSEENKYTISEELLLRYFSGEANDAEQEFVDNWAGLSEENTMEYEQFHLFYMDSQALKNQGQESREYDVEAAWDKVSQKHGIQSDSGGKQVSLFSSQLFKAAAIVLCFVGIGWLVYNYNSGIENVVVSAADDTKKQILAEGSVVILNKESTLTYPAEFKGKERRVKLSGEAYFDIASDPQKPFIVETGALEVKVVGTAFNISALEDLHNIVVSVDEGIVLVTSGQEQVSLEAGTEVIYNKQTNTFVKNKASDIVAHNYWRTNRLSFHGASLAEVIEVINSNFGANVVLSNQVIEDCKISVSFEGESLENILDVIALTHGLEIVKDNDRYSISGERCED